MDHLGEGAPQRCRRISQERSTNARGQSRSGGWGIAWEGDHLGGLFVTDGASLWSRCRQDRRQEALLSARYKMFIDIHLLSSIKFALATQGPCAWRWSQGPLLGEEWSPETPGQWAKVREPGAQQHGHAVLWEAAQGLACRESELRVTCPSCPRPLLV